MFSHFLQMVSAEIRRDSVKTSGPWTCVLWGDTRSNAAKLVQIKIIKEKLSKLNKIGQFKLKKNVRKLKVLVKYPIFLRKIRISVFLEDLWQKWKLGGQFNL